MAKGIKKEQMRRENDRLRSSNVRSQAEIARLAQTNQSLGAELVQEKTARTVLDGDHRKLSDLHKSVLGQNAQISASLEELQRQLIGKEDLRAKILAYAHQRPEGLSKKFISVEGVSASGKTTLVDTIDQAFSNAGYNGLITKGKGNSLDVFRPARETALSTASEKLENRDIELAYGLTMTAGRLLSFGHLLRSLSGDPGFLFLNRYYITTLYHQVASGLSPGDAVALSRRGYIVPDLSIILLCNPDWSVERSRERYMKEGRDREALETLRRNANALYTLVGNPKAPNIPNAYVVEVTEYDPEQKTLRVKDPKTVFTEVMHSGLRPLFGDELTDAVLNCASVTEGISSK